MALALEQTATRFVLKAAMPLKIVPYAEEHVAAVAAFNERARSHSAPFELSKSPNATWLPKGDGRTLFREFFLALDGSDVRGGFILRRQDFWIDGKEVRIANYQGPLSEGIWDRRYMMAGVQMLRSALRDQPLLYALGMGGMEQPLPKLLASAGWQLVPVPFLFKVLRASPFLRNLQPLRRKSFAAALADVAAWTGTGAMAIHAVQGFRNRVRKSEAMAIERVAKFGSWADAVWDAARESYLGTAIRDQKNQNVLFGDGNEKNMILRMRDHGRDIGWAVVRSTPMRDDKYFGNMRLGSIVDCLAVPGAEATVVTAAVRHLEGLGSDLVVTNQTHESWIRALRSCGFWTGPSNFILACSPGLTERWGPLDAARPRIHFNRSDGDGPIHL